MDASGHVSPIASLRAERGWSQVRLAEASGVSQPVIARLETGMQQPKRVHLEKIAAAFGMAASDLLKAMEGGNQVRATVAQTADADASEVLEPNNIRALRESKGLTLQALGDLVGTTPMQISRLERGDRRLTVDWMRKIAPALGVEPSDLMDGAPAAPRNGSAFPAESGHTILIRRAAIEAAERIVAQAGPINAAPRDIVRQIVTEVFGFQMEGGAESR